MKPNLKGKTLLLILFLIGGQLGAQVNDTTISDQEITKDSSVMTIPDDSLVERNMVYVEGGSFMMGCSKENPDCDFDAEPKHQVTLDGFYIGKYEVTQQEWFAVMGTYPSDHKDCPNCPVEKVNWEDAQAYCKALSAKTGKAYRLPTEAEWEYAARGGNKSASYSYAGGDTLFSVGWVFDNSKGRTDVVGKKQANELGLYDMTGNVLEWCNDWYGDDYYKKSPSHNPMGPANGYSRILRGASWMTLDFECNILYRAKTNSANRFSTVGFRVVYTP